MSSDFYARSIGPLAPIIIKICRAFTNTQQDFEDYFQEVCLQIWRSHRTFDERSACDRIQCMLRINEIAITIGAPITWILLSAVGVPYTGAILWTALMGLLVV